MRWAGHVAGKGENDKSHRRFELEIMRGGDTEAGEKNKQKLISKNLSA
jgi:hypothetical protein